MKNIDALKHSIEGSPKYRLKNATVYVSPSGFHYTRALDAMKDVSPDVDPEAALTDEDVAYIEQVLQSSSAKYDNQVEVVRKYVSIAGKKALDIGCGGGLFLSLLKREGAKVCGIELSASRAHYARTRHGLEVINRPIETDYWQSDHVEAFDIVTMWDVIEHVNYPAATLESAARVLRSGGYFLIDTPCRDGFYHRVGALTYRLSKGRYPTFLNSMYSEHRFGHKQIFSLVEMRTLFEDVGLEVLEAKEFHELSFPYRHYLTKLLNSDRLAALVEPGIRIALRVFPVRNKMVVVGRKR